MGDMIMIYLYMLLPVVAAMLGFLYLSVRYCNKKFKVLWQELSESKTLKEELTVLKRAGE